jgi:hypothetical protein
VTARERSLPIDRLFPFGRGFRGGGLISTQLQGGRGARLASRPGFRSAQSGLQPARRGFAAPAPDEYAEAGFQYDGICMANAVPASQRGAIWTRISLSLNPGYGLQ